MSQRHTSQREETISDVQRTGSRIALELVRDGVDGKPAIARSRDAIVAFDGSSPPAADAGLLLAALAATCPATIPIDIGDALAEVIRNGDLKRTWQPAVDEAFGLLALLVPTPAHAVIPALARDVLFVPNLHPRWYWKAIDLLQSLIDWQPDAADVTSLVSAAELIPQREATALFLTIIAPLLLADPAGCDLALVERAVGVLEAAYEARYFLEALGNQDHTPETVRALAQKLNADAFPLREIWRKRAGQRPLHVLCIQNIADGQGDEMIRTVPLLQALLDDDPETRITLVTNRGYLYDHPRIETLSFDDKSSISDALNRPIDGIIEFFEPRVLHLNHDIELAYSIAMLRSRIDLGFDIRASKKWNHFTFDNVWIGGLDWANALQFNQPQDNSVYDPVVRLIAELGLPLRTGEQRCRSESVLIDAGWSSADSGWAEATRSNTEQRPVALLNPFGGSARLKGFVPQKFDELASIVTSLLDESFFVVICPSGSPWGSHDAIDALLSRLPESTLRFIGVASRSTVAGHAASDHDPYLASALSSETMRGYLSYVARADLIVTVEGWMMHAAYLLAKPFRTLMMAESGGRDWQPWGHSRRQRYWLIQGDPSRDHPLLPEQPRKDAWLELLRRISDPDWYTFLRTVDRTDDQEIRAASIRALGRVGVSDIVPYLVSLLEDRSHIIRGVAAEALLNFHRDGVECDEIPGAATLEAYRLIGAKPFEGWETLLHRGPTALPALRAALHGDEPIMRREAAIVLERISREIDSEAAGATLSGNR